MTTMAFTDPPVDTRRGRYVPFPHSPGVDVSPGGRTLIPVGPGVRAPASPSASGAHRDDVSGYPIQYAKVQPPPLREDTLARHRLLDWLASKIHQRIVLVLADAGYGKTTLLADFAARTRLRTLWYRLDEDDRDWISLLSHLVAAGREADPGFAPSTAAMLADTSLGGPTRDTVIEVFLREMQAIAPQGAVLIIDDFHLVDEAPDAQLIAREIVAHAPERLTIVFASRRSPGIPMAKLRATGEVAELTTDDLRFDAQETEQLFRETYRRTLEPDVLADVTARTEGWAASLQLVHAALRDRTPKEIRGFVRGLTGADHELYDYLAEEVVGDLPADMQRFLMRTSILQVVTREFAQVVTGIEASDVARLTTTAERVTLLARRARGPRDELRYHPLVREFLEARLLRDDGVEAVRDLHRAVAAHAQDRDWRVAAHHLWSAGDRSRAFDLIDTAAKGIIGRGEYLVAASFLTEVSGADMRANFEVVLSRRDFKEGDVRRALSRAERAVELDPRSQAALVNLASLSLNTGDVSRSAQAAGALLEIADDPAWTEIGHALIGLIGAALDGNIEESRDRLLALADEHKSTKQTHFEGISLLNLAECYRALDSATDALRTAHAAIDCFESSSSAAEMASARAIAAWARVHLGDMQAGWDELDVALEETHPAIGLDVLVEAAHLEAFYGDINRATEHLSEASSRESFQGLKQHLAPISAYVGIRHGDADGMSELSDEDVYRATAYPTYRALALAVRAHGLLSMDSPRARAAIAEATAQAKGQSAFRWLNYCLALAAIAEGPESLSRFARRRTPMDSWCLSYVAELVVSRIGQVDAVAMAVIAAEVGRRPRRWLPALRSAVDRADSASGLVAARLLETHGAAEDVPRLRLLAHRHRGQPEAELGRALARSTAARVTVEDLGRVTIRVGSRTIEGSSIRRKVLALLCFLLTRPRSSATRDEVMDALWPEFDPTDALNSLSQTIYFLRRVFEPNYKDDLSPGYVHHELPTWFGSTSSWSSRPARHVYR